MTVPRILDDDREIIDIIAPNYDVYFVIAGHEPPGYVGGPYTRIVAYGEPDESGYDYVPWFAVFSGEKIVARVPAHRCVKVGYE